MNDQLTNTDEPLLSRTKTTHKGTNPIIVTLLILIVLGSVGYSIYAWMQNQQQQVLLKSNKDQVQSLGSQLSSLKASMGGAKQTGNIVLIRELGIEMTVPDSIKDITYSYTSGYRTEGASNQVVGDIIRTAGLSTVSMTDKYNSTQECTSFRTPPLGGLSRGEGKYSPGNDSTLVKQFPTFYIIYSGPQSLCSKSQTTISAELNALMNSFSTIKEL